MRGLEVFFLATAMTLLDGRASPASAQRPGVRVAAHPEVGLRAGRDFSVDAWTAGAHVRIPFGATLEFRPSADLALEDIGGDFQVNGDLALRGPRDQAYIGAGLGYVHRQFDSGKDSGTGINIFIGFKPIPRPGTQIYVEGRWTFVDSETIFRVSLGIAVPL